MCIRDSCECEQLHTKIKNSQLNNTAKRAAVVVLLVHRRRSNKFVNSLRETKEYCKSHKTVSYTHLDVYKRQMVDITLHITDAYETSVPSPLCPI